MVCTGSGNGTAQFDDPLGYYSTPSGTTFPSLGLTETKTINPSGKAACVDEKNLNNDDTALGVNSSLWGILLGTTNANFTAVSIDPTLASFFQTQQESFRSNLTDLRNSNPSLSKDLLDWCVLNSPIRCPSQITGSPQGYFATTGNRLIVATEDNSEYYSAPSNVQGSYLSGTTPTPVPQFICVDDTLENGNFACAAASLIELGIALNPSPIANPAELGPGQQQAFMATVDATANGAASQPPASLLAEGLDGSLSWSSWQIGGPSPNCPEGTVNPTVTTADGISQDTYLYCAPNNNVGPGTAEISANVNMPSGNGNVALAPVTGYFNVSSNPTKQIITFPQIATQTVGSTVTLAATASSNLPVAFATTTPSVVSISGTTATMTSVGTATIVAEQTGNSTYSAAIATQNFTVGPGPAAAPTFSPGPGTYNSIPTIAIGSSSPGTSIYFTHDGTTPTTASAQFTAPFQVKNSFTYQAIATGGLYTTSAVTSATYTLVALPPVFSPPAGTYPGPLTLTLTSASPNTDIFYLIGSGQAGASSTLYKTPITVASSETINAVTAQTGWTPSANITQAYTIEPYAAAPTFSVATGSYATAQTVALADSTAGATIYYTTDGSTPTTSSSLYTGPIAVTASETLTAIAAASGYSNSPATAVSYTIQ